MDCAPESSLQTDEEGRRQGHKSEEEQQRGSDDLVKRQKAGRKRLRIKKRGLLRERRGVECGGEGIRVEG